MVLADRWWRGLPVPAVRHPMVPVLHRVLLLAGLAAAGWLLGGTAAAATADDLPTSGLPAVSGVAESAGQTTGRAAHAAERTTDRAADAEGEAASTPEKAVTGSTESAGGDGAGAEQGAPADTSPVADESAEIGATDRTDETVNAVRRHTADALPEVARTSRTAGAAARDVVEGTARDTGHVVSDTVRTGQKVHDYANESLGTSRLAGTVSGGLTDGTERIGDGLGAAIDGGSRATAPSLGGGLPALGDALGPRSGGPAAHDQGAGASARDDAADADQRRTSARDRADASAITALARHAAQDAGAADSDAADTRAGQSGAGDTDQDSGSPWRSNADSTGTVSSSSAPAAAAGFLVPRHESPHVLAHRVALPGEPAPVVRDAADDPSFSPD